MAYPFAPNLCVRDLIKRMQEIDPSVKVEVVVMKGPPGIREIRRVMRDIGGKPHWVTLPSRLGEAGVIEAELLANICRRLGFNVDDFKLNLN